MLKYNDILYNVEFILCPSCEEMVDYSIQRLYECSHDVKPRCRKCETPCYDKKEWKKIAKIMIYSNVFLKLSSVKNTIKEKLTMIKNANRKKN
jgi:hypothetical protein